MRHAVVLKHAPFEGPGRLSGLLAARGYAVEVRELYRGDPVPSDLGKESALIVMGGPMGVPDQDRAELGFLRQEIALLARRIEEDAPTLGVCLGAQLLAAAAGAGVGPMTGRQGERVYEVGWGLLRFHREPGAETVLRDLPEQAPMLHWHGDAFEIPTGARRLASTNICQNQAFQLRSRLVGLQFHAEPTAEGVEGFLGADGDFVERALGRGGAERIRQDTRRWMEAHRAVGDRLLENILQAFDPPERHE